jgi:hypothetical protein
MQQTASDEANFYIVVFRYFDVFGDIVDSYEDLRRVYAADYVNAFVTNGVDNQTRIDPRFAFMKGIAEALRQPNAVGSGMKHPATEPAVRPQSPWPALDRLAKIVEDLSAV